MKKWKNESKYVYQKHLSVVEYMANCLVDKYLPASELSSYPLETWYPELNAF